MAFYAHDLAVVTTMPSTRRPGRIYRSVVIGCDSVNEGLAIIRALELKNAFIEDLNVPARAQE